MPLCVFMQNLKWTARKFIILWEITASRSSANKVLWSCYNVLKIMFKCLTQVTDLQWRNNNELILKFPFKKMKLKNNVARWEQMFSNKWKSSQGSLLLISTDWYWVKMAPSTGRVLIWWLVCAKEEVWGAHIQPQKDGMTRLTGNDRMKGKMLG